MTEPATTEPAEPLYHMALRADWEAAQEAAVYTVSTRGVTLEEQGFIHCSYANQIRPVADHWYRADAGEVVLLEIDPAKLGSTEVRVEELVPGDGAYPHLYGPLPLSAIVSATPLGHDSEGRLILPL